MTFLASNSGGVPGLITGAQLNYNPTGHETFEISLTLNSGVPLIINPNEQKSLSVNMSEPDSELQEYVRTTSAKNFGNDLIQGACSVDFFINDRSVSSEPDFFFVREVNVGCYDVVVGLMLQPGSALKK